jgi:hypothetical protein
VGEFVGAVDDAGERADDEIGDPVSFEGCEDRVRVEWRGLVALRGRLGSGAQHPLDPALGRDQCGLAHAGKRAVVALREFERKLIAAHGK